MGRNQFFEIKENWEFRMIGNQEWFPAKVPGCVHKDLLTNKLIPEPFYRDNETKLYWIDKVPFEYKTTFNITKDFLKYENIELHFKGLDTYAKVYLNGKLILVTNNMFREWKVEIKKLLKEGDNLLLIYFDPPFLKGLLEMEKSEDKIPYYISPLYEFPKEPLVSPFTRKASYQYGWDWAPKLTTSGIWRKVFIHGWDKARINYLHILQKKLNKEKASLSALFEVETKTNQEAVLKLSYKIRKEEHKVPPVRVTLRKGINQIPINFEIIKPKLWWPNGFGAQPIYEFTGKIIIDNKEIDSIKVKTGLRVAKLIRNKDKKGESFYFEINGIPIFAKGANYIPCSIFPQEALEKNYREILSSAKEANMNMLRVWGGGIYEEDLFYDLCDKYGIMIWQDFMFACHLYPGDKNFFKNVEREIIDNIKRLKNHPCIVIWCGNNEIEIVKNRIQKEIKENYPELIPKIQKAYEDLFYKLLPKLCKKYDNSRPYWPSSPCGGFRKMENSNSGDVHYWGVWHKNHPLEKFQEKKGRFFSEWGFQAYPPLKTIEEFTNQEDLQIFSYVMKLHQKSPLGNEKIDSYLKIYYRPPKNFEHYIYVSELLQAEAGKLAIETHRKWKPYTMGTLYWQLNDCWPAISWSSLDYKNRWKAFHYYAKKAYTPILPIVSIYKGFLEVKVVSDLLKPFLGKLEMKIIDFKGKEKWKDLKEIKIEPNSCKSFFKEKETKLLKGINKKSSVFVVSLTCKDKVFTTNLFYFLPPKDLILPKPKITKKIRSTKKGYEIELFSENLVKNVYLSFEGEGFFSDNFFDLLPKEKKIVSFVGKEKDFIKKLKIISLFDIYKEEKDAKNNFYYHR
ncbi:MAG: glycoside hydrolase family 2 protein [candidate division WOR-3 bacterium]